MLSAKANITKTWEDLLAEGRVQDRDAELGEVEYKYGLYIYQAGGILLDPNSSVVGLMLYIYQMTNFCFYELNRSIRCKDSSKVITLGPWAAAFYQII